MTPDPNNPLGSAENEDLFDFPLVGVYASQSLEAESEPAETQAAAPVETPVAEAAPTPPAAKQAAPVAQDSAELDEDLFNFETQFEASQPLTDADEEMDLAALLEQHEASEAAADAAAPPIDLGPIIPPVAGVPAESKTATVQPAAAPVAPTQKTPQATARAPRVAVSSDIPASMWTPPAAAPAPEPKRGQLVNILALCFLVLTSALVFFGWRASEDFRATLASVTNTVSDAVADGHSRGQVQNMGTQGSMNINPDVQTTRVEPVEDTPHDSSKLVLLPRASLDLAIDRIAEGRFQTARQGLFHLLANQDRSALTDEMVVEAEALIAQAFADQAKEIQE